jgi:hypothetical protein
VKDVVLNSPNGFEASLILWCRSLNQDAPVQGQNYWQSHQHDFRKNFLRIRSLLLRAVNTSLKQGIDNL